MLQTTTPTIFPTAPATPTLDPTILAQARAPLGAYFAGQLTRPLTTHELETIAAQSTHWGPTHLYGTQPRLKLLRRLSTDPHAQDLWTTLYPQLSRQTQQHLGQELASRMDLCMVWPFFPALLKQQLFPWIEDSLYRHLYTYVDPDTFPIHPNTLLKRHAALLHLRNAYPGDPDAIRWVLRQDDRHTDESLMFLATLPPIDCTALTTLSPPADPTIGFIIPQAPISWIPTILDHCRPDTASIRKTICAAYLKAELPLQGTWDLSPTGLPGQTSSDRFMLWTYIQRTCHKLMIPCYRETVPWMTWPTPEEARQLLLSVLLDGDEHRATIEQWLAWLSHEGSAT